MDELGSPISVTEKTEPFVASESPCERLLSPKDYVY